MLKSDRIRNTSEIYRKEKYGTLDKSKVEIRSKKESSELYLIEKYDNPPENITILISQGGFSNYIYYA